MADKLILVTGATGYIASRLIPRLLDSGYRVRALARNPHRLQARAWFNKIDFIQADVTSSASLVHAFDGVDTAYYLIHNMSQGHGYTSLEPDAARNFAQAAETAGIKHIIYLGGLADPEQHIAPHMRSRIETGKVLREGKVPVTEFRAGVITGSGSISFEMIRFMTELFSIIPAPLWMKNKSQPIAIQNVIDYLLAALTNKNGQGHVFEIGGPEITTYKDLMLHYARIRKLNRAMLLLPGIPTWFMAFGVDLMTPVPYPIAHALIAGLSTDSIVKHPEALTVFPEVKLIDFDSATKDALEKTHPDHIERVWDDDSKVRFIKHEGCFILHFSGVRQLAGDGSKSPPLALSKAIAQTKRGEGEGRRAEPVEVMQESYATSFGKIWYEWHTRHVENVTYLSQTIFFAPRGLPGFIYWFLLYPFHLLKFHQRIRNITRQIAG